MIGRMKITDLTKFTRDQILKAYEGSPRSGELRAYIYEQAMTCKSYRELAEKTGRSATSARTLCLQTLYKVMNMIRKTKTFDITQHEWSYQDITSADAIDGLVFISLGGSSRFTISLDREDSIALAKHFGVTGGDLK